MRLLGVTFLFIGVFMVTAGAVAWQSERVALYESQTEIAQSQTEGIVAQAESRAEIAGYQSSVDLAGINAGLEIARLQMEITKLDSLIESEKIQAALAQTNALLTLANLEIEKAKTERARMWVMVVISSMAIILAVFVVMFFLVVLLRRPLAPIYPRITMNTPSREIVPSQPNPHVIAVAMVGRRNNVDHYERR
jgi:hypothetical protein